MKTTISIFILFTAYLATYAQDSIPNFFQSQRNLLREKLYLHTDKPYYAAGDTIWFRGTLVNADTHSYLVYTNFIYVELINNNDSIIERKKIKRDGLCFHNNFKLPAELTTGTYYLRGYTKWMQNFDSQYFHSKLIHINNPYIIPTQPTIATAGNKSDYAVTFLPEGGTLLQNTEQKIAFMAQASNGYGEDIEGWIINNKEDTIATFESIHNGMGTFYLKVPQSEKLKAVTQNQRGVRKEFELPQAQEKGCALAVEKKGSSLHYKVLSTHEDTDSLLLVVHSRSNLMECKNIVPNQTDSICTKTYPEGIIHLIVCNKQGKALSRRLAFVWHGKPDDWSIEPDNLAPQAREKVRLNIQLKDGDGKPLQGDFSVSITDANQITPDTEYNNILSNLLLTSDLKGEIENPAWYFKDNTLRIDTLDLVMLTHGWSRFETDNLNKTPHIKQKHPIEAEQYITGQVKGLPKGKAKNNITAYNPEFKMFVTDSIAADGTFCINGLEIPDSVGYFLKVLTPKKESIRIRVNQDETPLITHKPIDWSQRDTTLKNNLSKAYSTGDFNKIIEIPEVIIKERFKGNSLVKALPIEVSFTQEQLEKEFNFEVIYTALDLVNEMMQTRFPNKFLNGPSDIGPDDALLDSHVFEADFEETSKEDRKGMRYKSKYWGRLKTAIINNQIFTGFGSVIDALDKIDSRNISRIDFIHSEHNIFNPEEITYITESGVPVMMLMRSALVSITLKPGKELGSTSSTEDPRIVLAFPQGYSWPEFFYHPVYNTPQDNIEKPDNRTTIYWHPSVQTDDKGTSYIEFYTSDNPNNYFITIEGVCVNGKPIVYLGQF